jgi:hypothetical protein
MESQKFPERDGIRANKDKALRNRDERDQVGKEFKGSWGDKNEKAHLKSETSAPKRMKPNSRPGTQ